MQSKLLVGLCLICGGAAIAWSRAPSDAASPYQVVHGWPQLPEGFALGQVSGVGVDSHDHIFVFHRGDRPILSFDGSTGKLLASSGDGMFTTPHGISLDADGRVYVADRANARVQVFDGNGKFLAQWKSPELGRPWDVTAGPDGFVYVVDGGDMNPKPPDRGRLLKLDRQGRVLETWSSFGKYDGQIYWGHAVAVGKNGDV